MAETQHDKSPPDDNVSAAFTVSTDAPEKDIPVYTGDLPEDKPARGRPRGSGKVQRALDYIDARKEALAKNPHALPVPELDALERILR